MTIRQLIHLEMIEDCKFFDNFALRFIIILGSPWKIFD